MPNVNGWYHPRDDGTPAHEPIALHLMTRWAVAITLVMLGLHLFAASRLELMFDEAYYRLWAQNLQWGYHDHPPAIAAWIRLSTTLFGNSEFGVRALGVIATAFGALGVFVITRDLFDSAHKGALAALIWNAVPLVGVGAILATPDTPLLFGWTTALWGLGRLYRTNDWRWWLLIGAAAGIALQAKYTALFLGPGIALAMLVVPQLRRWWSHPAPYAGGVLALAIFAPNIIWNARNGWETFAKQFGRIGDSEWTWRFIVDFFGSQIGLLGPLTFVLVVAGFILAIRGTVDETNLGGRRLLASLCAPLLVYFAFHSLHDRVQGNWMAPLYPAFAILAADAAWTTITPAASRNPLLVFARMWAIPAGLTLTGLIYLQALLAPLPLPPRSDPTALLTGWRQLGRDLDELATRQDASYILTQGYALTGLLKVYGPASRPVFQFNERHRWAYEAGSAKPDSSRPGLFIVELKRAGAAAPLNRFSQAKEIARLERKGRRAVLETYVVYRLAAPTTEILDPIGAAKR